MTHFSLVWDRYQSSICSSFGTLQQNGDFVDLTLAADGHMVKVHQLILGAASPYIKDIIQSVPCKHPVIFLKEVSYPTLCNLLQYVYTGEVAIAEDNLTAFLEAAKSLRIQGLDETIINNGETCDTTTTYSENDSNRQNIQNFNIQLPNEDSIARSQIQVSLAIPANIDVPDSSPQIPSPKSGVKRKIPINTPFDKTRPQTPLSLNETVEPIPIEAAPEEIEDIEVSSFNNHSFELNHLVDAYKKSNDMQYTVSNRGSLQMILNRYIYNLYSKGNGGQLRRWRCVDYRALKCPACTVTNGNVVVQRTRLHNHPYHDKKILDRIDRKAVYSAFKPVDTNQQTHKQTD